MALDIKLLSQGLLSTIVDGGFYPMEAYNRVLKVAVYGTVKPRSMDTCIIRTPHYCAQFALSLGKESPYIFSKFNPLSVLINGV